MKVHLFLLVFSMLMISCASNQELGSAANQANQNASYDDSPTMAVDLTTRLKGYAGLRVMGSGPTAQFTIRGINSLTSNVQPLMILNNNPVSSYVDLYNMVSASSIKRIEVLKNPGDLGIYGFRGANGVIKITTE